jgi:hypothetical protein
MFSSLIKRQICNCRENIEELLIKVREIEESIEAVVERLNHQTKGGHGSRLTKRNHKQNKSL